MLACLRRPAVTCVSGVTGMSPNSNFVSDVTNVLPDKDTAIVLVRAAVDACPVPMLVDSSCIAMMYYAGPTLVPPCFVVHAELAIILQQ